jgi:uncharacterized protein (DUF952 family)
MRLSGKTPVELHTQKACLKLKAGKCWERQIAFITVLWEQLPIVHIKEREQAMDRHKAIEEQYRGRGSSLLVYIDDNTHGGHIRVAAVARDRYRHHYMGLKSQSIIYAAELQGIRMGLPLVVHNARVKDLFIFTDNQATIQAIYCP